MGRNLQRVSDSSSDKDSDKIQEIARPPAVSKGGGGGGTRSRPSAASSSKVKVNSQSSNVSSSKGKGKASDNAHTKPSKALRKQLQQRPARQRESSHTAQEDGDGSDDSDDSVVVVASGPTIVVSRGSKRKNTAQSPKKPSAAQSTRIVLSDDETGSSRNGEVAAGPFVRREKQRTDHVKKGKTVVDAIHEDDEEDDDNEATPKKSFLERLEDNATPKFSSTFKARVKSRNDTSIPLADERFDSESEDTAYESEDLPPLKGKAHPSLAKQASSPRKRKAAEPAASTSKSKRPTRDARSTASEEDGGFIVPDDEIVSIHDTESEAPESVQNGGKGDAKKINKQKKRNPSERPSETDESIVPEKQKKEKKKKFKKPKTKYHEPSLQPESDQEMTPYFSPPRVAVPSRSSQLSTMSSARKKKEKARKRVVASPSESPPPQRQIVSEDDENAFLPSKASSKRDRKPASRQTQSSSKPLFIGSSDNESDAPAPRKKRAPSPIIDSEEDEAPFPPPRRLKGKGKQKASSRMQIDDDEEEDESGSHLSEEAPQKKRSKRFEHESSESESSSSSGSSDEDAEKPVSHASSKESELVDDLKDIELDFNPVKKEKLRPKDLSKGSRLDKLKLAREAKQRKDERRRKGIIDSDEDNVKDEEKSGSEESEGSDTSDQDDDQDLDGNVKNFIISDEEMDDDEREQMEKNIPIELTRHGKLELEQHFKVFITYLVYLFFLPRDKRVLKDKYYMFSLEAVRKAVGGVINSSVASSIWKEEFRKALDTRPIYIEDYLDKRPGCDGCSRHDRTASIRSAISGKRYDPLTFEEESESEDEEQIFELGCFCAERARIHTQLRHFMYHAAQEVFDECRERSRLPAKISGDREERRKRKDEEAAYVMQQWKDQLSQPPTRLWIELRDLLNLAKIKYVR